ncbi:MAG TPA: AAA family ATPase, partial [Candidatus Synoicihabitans sp.]|nr:AAA family ATPase [Candidatus Synoicihabitans sp.]
MIASIAFRKFKALRNASLTLAPFNLLVGPNGSGKSSLIQALLRLRTLAKLPLKAPTAAEDRVPQGPRISLRFHAPHEGVEAVMSCVSDLQCDLLELIAPTGPVVPAEWTVLRDRLLGIRAYLLDHYAIALPAPRHDRLRLSSNGG